MDRQLAQRLIESKPKTTNDKGCWLWTGGINQLGYGYIGKHGERHYVHRLAAYLYLDYDLDDRRHIICHKPIVCPNRNCFNPEHIYVGDYVSNMHDATLEGRSNAARTHCSKGHRYDEANTMTKVRQGRLKRDCRTCHNERRLARYHRLRWGT